MEKRHKSLCHHECEGCLHREEVNLKNVEPLEDPAKNVNEVLSMDLVGPLTLSTNENKYILTLLDQFSRFCAVVPIHNKSAKTVFTEILKQIGSRRTGL